MNLDDDVLQAARSLASTTGRSLGSVVSELMRKGLAPQPQSQTDDIPTFRVSKGAPTVTPEMVKEALNDEW